MEADRFRKSEILGILFTFILGVILKYSYIFSHKAVWSIIVGSVNSSVWEYIKVFLLPYALWSFIEMCIVRVSLKRFLISKVLGLYALIIGGIIFLSIIRCVVKTDFSVLESVGWLCLICLAFAVSCRTYVCKKVFESWFSVFFFLMLLAIAAYLSFTVSPPKLNMFIDSTTKTYGF